MEENICVKCEKIFSSKYNLKRHVDSSQTCKHLVEEHENKVNCEYCLKKYANTYVLKNHYKVCKNKKEEENIKSKLFKLEEQLAIVQNKYEIYKNLYEDINTKYLELSKSKF